MDDRGTDMTAGLGGDADHQPERLAGCCMGSWAGCPMRSWMEEARRWVSEHPLHAIAVTVAVGFLLGKIFNRR